MFCLFDKQPFMFWLQFIWFIPISPIANWDVCIGSGHGLMHDRQQATIRYSNQRWLCPITSKCVTRLNWINEIYVSRFITRGQFWPSVIVVACVCLSVCPSVRMCFKHLLVRAITHHPFKLGSPNLDHRCKIPWLRSPLFWGWLTLTFKIKFIFKVKIYPILSLSMPWLTTNWSYNFQVWHKNAS